MASVPTVTLTAATPTAKLRVSNETGTAGGGSTYYLTASDNAAADFDQDNWDRSIAYSGSGTRLPQGSGNYHDVSLAQTATLLRLFLFAWDAKQGDPFQFAFLLTSPDATWTDEPQIVDRDGALVVDTSPASGDAPAKLTLEVVPTPFTFDNETDSTSFLATADSDGDGRFKDASDWQTSGTEYADAYDIGNAKGPTTEEVLQATAYYRFLVYASKSDDPTAGALVSADWKTVADSFGDAYAFTVTAADGTQATVRLGSGASPSPSPSSSPKPNPWSPTAKGPLGAPMWVWYAVAASALVVLLAAFARANRPRPPVQ